MKLAMLTIADYAAVRPDGTIDVVRGGQSIFVVAESAPTLTRSIAFQLFLTESEASREGGAVRITVHDADGGIAAGAECPLPPRRAGATTAEPDDGGERYPAGGVLHAELALEREGEFKLALSAGRPDEEATVLGEQLFVVIRIPDAPPAAMPAEIVEAVRDLA